MRRPRPIPLIVSVVCFLAFVGLSALLAQRLIEHQRESGREVFAFQPVEATDFTYAGRPVSLVETTDDRGNLKIDVTYGDEELRLTPSVTPGHRQLPFHVRHQNWLGVFRFAPRSGMTMEEFVAGIESGDVKDRLVLVQRGQPPKSEGDVQGRAWYFELREFLEEGGFETQRLFYPTTRRGEAPKPGELAPGTWEYDAALLLMPKHETPSPSFIDDAMQSAGWALPAAAFAMLGAVAGLAIAFAPARVGGAGDAEGA